MWDLPGSGIEPMSPALAGGLFTLTHQGGPDVHFLKRTLIWLSWGLVVSCSLPALSRRPADSLVV